MLKKDMIVEEAARENPKVMGKLLEYGLEYDFVALEELGKVLEEENINFEDFLNAVGEVQYEDLDRIYKMTKEEIVNYIVSEIHPYELATVEKIDSLFRKAIKKYYRQRGEQLFVIYEVLLLIKAELVSHFSSEEEFEFKELLEGKEVDFENLLGEHEKIIGLFDRIKYLTRDYKMNAEEEEVKELNELVGDLDIHSRRHIFIENEILFKM